MANLYRCGGGSNNTEMSVITVTTTSDSFEGLTVSCTGAGKTQTSKFINKTCTFKVAYTGNYTISVTCSGSVYSEAVTVSAIPASYNVSINASITVNLTVYSASSDTVYYYEGSTKVTLCTTNANGVGSATLTLPASGKTIVFYSTVAKNPSNLSNPYTKSITVNASTSSIYVMPDGVIYWYGYQKSTFSISGYTCGYTSNLSALSKGTNAITLTYQPYSARMYALGTSDKLNLSSYTKLKMRTNLGVSTFNKTSLSGYAVICCAKWGTSQDVSTFNLGFANAKTVADNYSGEYEIKSTVPSTLYAIWAE